MKHEGRKICGMCFLQAKRRGEAFDGRCKKPQDHHISRPGEDQQSEKSKFDAPANRTSENNRNRSKPKVPVAGCMSAGTLDRNFSTFACIRTPTAFRIRSVPTENQYVGSQIVKNDTRLRFPVVSFCASPVLTTYTPVNTSSRLASRSSPTQKFFVFSNPKSYRREWPAEEKTNACKQQEREFCQTFRPAVPGNPMTCKVICGAPLQHPRMTPHRSRSGGLRARSASLTSYCTTSSNFEKKSAPKRVPSERYISITSYVPISEWAFGNLHHRCKTEEEKRRYLLLTSRNPVTLFVRERPGSPSVRNATPPRFRYASHGPEVKYFDFSRESVSCHYAVTDLKTGKTYHRNITKNEREFRFPPRQVSNKEYDYTNTSISRHCSLSARASTRSETMRGNRRFPSKDEEELASCFDDYQPVDDLRRLFKSQSLNRRPEFAKRYFMVDRPFEDTTPTDVDAEELKKTKAASLKKCKKVRLPFLHKSTKKLVSRCFSGHTVRGSRADALF